MVKVRLLKAWGLHPAGEVFVTDKSVADLLIQRGHAEEVVEVEKGNGKKKQ